MAEAVPEERTLRQATWLGCASQASDGGFVAAASRAPVVVYRACTGFWVLGTRCRIAMLGARVSGARVASLGGREGVYERSGKTRGPVSKSRSDQVVSTGSASELRVHVAAGGGRQRAGGGLMYESSTLGWN